MLLFILMPFIGGYVGYVYAPEKVVEVEKVVVKRESGDDQVDIKIANTQPFGDSSLRVLRDVNKSYVVVNSLPNVYKEYTIYDGDVFGDYVNMSPNKRFFLFKFKPCGDKGCDNPGGPMVFDTTDESNHHLEFAGDESAPFMDMDIEMVMPQIYYGSMPTWDESGNLIYEVKYKDQIYTYTSADKEMPWVLGYRGAK